MASSFQQNADSAKQTDKIASKAAQDTKSGGEAVVQTVAANQRRPPKMKARAAAAGRGASAGGHHSPLASHGETLARMHNAIKTTGTTIDLGSNNGTPRCR